MSNFLLIHGSLHGAWCWDHVIPLLEAAGHSARAIDLPSHGTDQTPSALVTLDMYAGKIRAAMHSKTILVGHSMAGYPITVAADQSPHMIEKLVYLCAHVPEPGKSIADMRLLADTQPLAEALIPSADGKTITFDLGLAHEKFYHDVDADLSNWAIAKLCPQPVAPQATPYAGSARTHARHYIRCMDDRAIPPAYQVDRTKDWPPETVSELPTSHSPFLSDPAALAAELIRIAES
jgi:pimeloyl-ACP methyl ester carboxylesterase